MFRKYYKLFKELISLSKERTKLCGGCIYYTYFDRYDLYDDTMKYNEYDKRLREIIQNLDFEVLKMIEAIIYNGKEIIYFSYPEYRYKRYTPKEIYEQTLKTFLFDGYVSEIEYRKNILRNYLLHDELKAGLKILGIYIPSNILKNGKPRTLEFADGTVCFRT